LSISRSRPRWIETFLKFHQLFWFPAQIF